jgi:hypothetical protein
MRYTACTRCTRLVFFFTFSLLHRVRASTARYTYSSSPRLGLRAFQVLAAKCNRRLGVETCGWRGGWCVAHCMLRVSRAVALFRLLVR